MGKYKTVVIDPPWTITNRDDRILPHGKVPLTYYDTMSFEEIRAFPINEFADTEALLFLWVVTKTIEKGFQLLRDWGFGFHQLITWDKGSGYAIWSPIMNRTEHCLFSYRGNFTTLIAGHRGVMQSLITSNHARKHSEKPAKFYQLLRAWTPAPRIDIFARNAHEGFDGWGDEYVGEGPLAEFL